MCEVLELTPTIAFEFDCIYWCLGKRPSISSLDADIQKMGLLSKWSQGTHPIFTHESFKLWSSQKIANMFSSALLYLDSPTEFASQVFISHIADLLCKFKAQVPLLFRGKLIEASLRAFIVKACSVLVHVGDFLPPAVKSALETCKHTFVYYESPFERRTSRALLVLHDWYIFCDADSLSLLIIEIFKRKLIPLYVSVSDTFPSGCLAYALQEMICLLGLRLRECDLEAHWAWNRFTDAEKMVLRPFVTSKYVLQSQEDASDLGANEYELFSQFCKRLSTTHKPIFDIIAIVIKACPQELVTFFPIVVQLALLATSESAMFLQKSFQEALSLGKFAQLELLLEVYDDMKAFCEAVPAEAKYKTLFSAKALIEPTFLADAAFACGQYQRCCQQSELVLQNAETQSKDKYLNYLQIVYERLHEKDAHHGTSWLSNADILIRQIRFSDISSQEALIASRSLDAFALPAPDNLKLALSCLQVHYCTGQKSC